MLEERHKILLKTCLLDDKESLKFWEELRQEIKINYLDLKVSRLYGLLYKKLLGLKVKDPIIEKLKPFYQDTWIKNQTIIHRADLVISCLEKAGVELILLKGLPLTLKYYKDYGVRPMSDIDLLISKEHIPLATKILSDLDYHPNSSDRKINQTQINCLHGFAFKNSTGDEIDLHWHALPETCNKLADENFWNNRIPIRVKEHASSTLNAADLLFHTCIHGSRWNPVLPIRWIADATVIIKNSTQDELNWSRLVSLSKEQNLTYAISSSLTLLNNLLNLKIPEDVFHNLSKPTKVKNLIQKLELNYKQKNYQTQLLGYLPLHLSDYVRSDFSTKKSIWGFLRYLSDMRNLPSIWHLPYELTRSTRLCILNFFSHKS